MINVLGIISPSISFSLAISEINQWHFVSSFLWPRSVVGDEPVSVGQKAQGRELSMISRLGLLAPP
jgi:hypothetical protein